MAQSGQKKESKEANEYIRASDISTRALGYLLMMLSIGLSNGGLEFSSVGDEYQC